MSSMAANPYGPPVTQAAPAAAAKPAAPLNPNVAFFTNPGQRAYAGITPGSVASQGLDLSSIPKWGTALTVSYADPFHPQVSAGVPVDQNIRFNWATPAQYRAYAATQLAARAKAAKAAAAKTAAGGAGTGVAGAGAAAAGYHIVPGTVDQIAPNGVPGAGSAAPGTINPGGPMIPYTGPDSSGAASAPGAGTQMNLPMQPAGTTAAGTTPASTIPNYQQLILSDPGYVQALANYRAGSDANEATRSGQTQAALINFGDPSSLQGSLAALGVDPGSAAYQNIQADMQAAQPQAQNLTDAGLSTLAGLTRDHAKDIDDLLQRAANTGTVESGYTGASLGNEDQAYSQAQFDARSKVINYLAGVQAAYASGQKSLVDTKASAASTAAANIAKLYPVAPNYSPTGPAGTALGQTGGGTPAAPAAPAPVPYFPRGTGAPAPKRRVMAPNVRQIGRNR